jgi:hypothetical protein
VTRPDRIARYLYDEPAPAPLVAVEPVLLPEPEPDAVDEHNPFGYVIYHADAGVVDPHDCRPRMRARCGGSCRRELVLCRATTDEVRAMLRGGWACGSCREAS